MTVCARIGSYSEGLPTAGYAAEMRSTNGQGNPGCLKLWRLSDWAQCNGLPLPGTYTISGFQANQVVPAVCLHRLGIRANGSTTSVEVDGVTRISVTDSSFSSGEVGLWSYDPSSANQHVFDDFIVQNLGQGSIPGSKVVAVQKALLQARTKAKPMSENWAKSAFTLTRQTGQVWRSYYYAGAARVAMQEVNDQGSEVYYILTDHLGSTSMTVYEDEQVEIQVKAQQWYKPWGEVRQVTGEMPTDYTFTGQREVEELGMLWYNSRFYDAQLGRFNQPDTVVPLASQGVQAWDRMVYANNNPVRYNDPSGHCLILCTTAIGAGIGAIVGAITYTVMNSSNFDTSEMLVAAGTGAAAGALIGSGVGLLAAPATTAAVATTATTMVGAGTGATGSALGYTITNSNTFETTPFVETTTVGGVVGGVSAALPVSSLGVAAKTATYIAGSETLYALQTDNWTVEGAQWAAVYGAVGAGFDVVANSAVSGQTSALGNQFPPKGPQGFIPPSSNADLMQSAARLRGGSAFLNTTSGVISGGFASITTKLVDFLVRSER